MTKQKIKMEEILPDLVKGSQKQRARDFGRAFDIESQNYGVVTPLRIAHFWAQMLHETGGLRWLTELGGRMYFRKYDGREDLGNTEPGDGYRFRGRGLIHLTGRHNYRKYGELLGVDLEENPGMAELPSVALPVALLYWDKKGLNRLADNDDIRTITRRINGGYNGLNDRTNWFIKLTKRIF